MLSKANHVVLKAYEKGYRVVKNQLFNPKGEQLSLYIDASGYFTYGIKMERGGRRITFGVHRLAAYQKFGGRIFEKGIQVRHRDGQSLNNWDYNILLGSQSDNMMDQPKKIRAARSKHAVSFLQKYDVKKVRAFYVLCRSYQKTKEKFGISSSGTLWYILNKAAI